MCRCMRVARPSSFLSSYFSLTPCISLIKDSSSLLARPRSARKNGRVAFSRGRGCFAKKYPPVSK
uniref:Uncharacterized protein n=1 Tax=Setaria viridis TaxID=4556 RepID=A0A4V6D7R7_SETVI|nr:hypothetical protein SEVIR_4G015701v2 [Setaria viridis]